MKTIGITGASGFLGQHLLSFFAARSNTIKIIPFVGDVRKQKQVERFVEKCELIVHLAGKNRAEYKEILETNIGGTINVINACYSHKKGVICAGTRYQNEDAYLISKNVCRSILSEYNKIGLQGMLIKLDNVIGTGCKPFYNSFTTTLMHLISRNLEYRHLIKNDNDVLELVDVDDVCRWVYSFCDSFLINRAFYVKEFEFWNPITLSIKELICLLSGDVVKNVSVENSVKILKIFEWYKKQVENEIY
ncbi:MAG: NAD-dependent epimerase/dehydratase family protein [Candidatus Parcubacteria bacterium]|nr:NAD-dependent epimerase/dehydratase family protein [Candidatus Parcubacteria bacterium]